ncbi:hypothetical protein CAEBREN_11354 [Caenorhabditis brenneri]|uniref:BTB domain-containing protein n=1 Tax=Caenorhabditis brenneri TaxID=135651 RepID=G0MV22_CAEBE|nr:hypothetical protein CAEBREN_11354 [Caenorhabditis brenneri]
MAQEQTHKNEFTFRFDDPDPNLHDVVSKTSNHQIQTLAKHSFLFYQMFFMVPHTMNKRELDFPFNMVSPSNLQVFLQLLHGVNSLTDENIRDVLDISMQCGAKAAVNQCIKFLKSESRMSTKKRFDIALRYNLEEFKRELISKCRSPDEINRILPADLTTLDHATLGLLFEKNLELQGFPGRYPPRQEDGDRSSFTESDTSEESFDDDEEW